VVFKPASRSYEKTRLTSVYDITTNDAGFKKGNTTQNDDFEYDNNGNLIVDRNKNITNITYNRSER